MSTPSENRPSLRMLLGFGALLILVAAAGWFSARHLSDPAAALSGGDRRAIEKVVHDYLLENPEIIPEAMENLQRKTDSKQLAGLRKEVETPFQGAVLGNPKGKETIVKFSDFGCGYCRQSVKEIDRLVKERPDLRVVVRDLPILSEQSEAAARMALAAAQQGKYGQFYHAMFAAGRPGPDTITAAAKVAGLDMARARKALSSPQVEAEIARNIDMARQLGFSGTPSWVAGEELISGAVDAARLREALDSPQG